MEIAPRITAEPDKLGGKPCIRGLRFPVADLIGLLAAGATPVEIVSDYPDLELDDIPAALKYAAAVTSQAVTWTPESLAAE
ncbi:MAG TPA: DUF433 domain-containing protein [Lautropia sp.]|nr:DUF433 domain-containing protein [Lautropia sp.]